MRIFTIITAALFCSVAHAQQGNLPAPVQKLSPYPPAVCVTPDWRPEPCEDKKRLWVAMWQREGNRIFQRQLVRR
jgi:hypothetical protein